ncbi:hypothetical protein GCM10028864_34520 [Microlunatus parietis]
MLIGSIGAALLMAGCAARPAGPRPLTMAEAERFAVVRFNNYDRRYVPFTLRLTVRGQPFFLTGRVDFRDQLGYANFLSDGRPPRNFLLQWTMRQKASLQVTGGALPMRPPAGPWRVEPTDPERSGLDAALALLLSLADDRPENALLLRQNGAQWVGEDNVDGVRVDRITGPGTDNRPSDRLTYLVDDLGRLHRLVAKVATDPDPVVINVSPDPATRISVISQLTD